MVSLDVRLEVTHASPGRQGGKIRLEVRLEVIHASPGRQRGRVSLEVRLEVTQTYNFSLGGG